GSRCRARGSSARRTWRSVAGHADARGRRAEAPAARGPSSLLCAGPWTLVVCGRPRGVARHRPPDHRSVVGRRIRARHCGNGGLPMAGLVARSARHVLLSGGSMADITGLVAVRNVFGAGVVYLSDQTHSSIARGLRSIGQADDELRILATDNSMRLPVDTLRQAVVDDRRSGRHPLMVVATAGTTNTGTVDDLPRIAELCRQEGLWLHIDAAYGGPAALFEPG